MHPIYQFRAARSKRKKLEQKHSGKRAKARLDKRARGGRLKEEKRFDIYSAGSKTEDPDRGPIHEGALAGRAESLSRFQRCAFVSCCPW
jgi:hypothetical protein